MYPSLGTEYSLEECGTLLTVYNLPEIAVTTESREVNSSYTEER